MHLVLGAGDGVDGQGDGGVADLDQDIDAVAIEPLADDRCAHVRLVLMVRLQQLDLDARIGGHELGDRLARTFGAGGALDVTVGAAEVGQRADADDLGLGVGFVADGDRCASGGQHCAAA